MADYAVVKSSTAAPPPPPPMPGVIKRPKSTSPTIVAAIQKFQGLALEPPTKDMVEIGSNGDDDAAEAVTREEEVITKRKTELTTTRQIETRVKRQVKLEDGKVVEDSGPIVSTNTTEDTEKQESETTERRKLGDPDAVDGPEPIEGKASGSSGSPVQMVATTSARKASPTQMVHAIVTRPDGLVREIKEKKVVSREETEERLETEDIKHLGDFSDEAYVKAVNSGAENIKTILLSPEAQRALVPIGPTLVHQSSKTHKTIDTEDIDQKCLAKPDGTLVTEKKKTTEHEELFDEDLPDADDKSTGSQEKLEHKEASQRYYKQRDEQNVEYVSNGKTIAKEMRYAAETEQMERDGNLENPSDWDSLSDRLRKARRQQKTLLQQHKEAALLGTIERRDALIKRPLDFDREEEIRKAETNKWLESHFGSESHSSRESRDEDVEPTKKSYFNVTIKSNNNVAPPAPRPIVANGNISNGYTNGNLISPSKVIIPERESPKTKYFQGITEWSERQESTPKQLASKTFQDELKGTLEKNRLRKQAAISGSKDELRYKSPIREVRENYQRKESVPLQKNARHDYQYELRDDGKYNRDSHDDSSESRIHSTQKEDLGYLSGSRNDLRYRKDSRDEPERILRNQKENGYLHREDSGYIKDSHEDLRYIRDSTEEERGYKELPRDHIKTKQSIQRDDSAYVSSSTYFTTPRSPPTRTPDSGIRSPSPDNIAVDDVRPTVPQRKRAMERKMKLAQNGRAITPKREEPPPDYSPPPRSRSISPSSSWRHYLQESQMEEPRKQQYQRTRFAPEQNRTVAATQTTPTKSSKMGSSIGNSIRKLVGKIRSASAERKLKMKSKRSPSPRKQSQQINNQNMIAANNSSTYQQYNVIDSHIGHSNRETSVTSSNGGRRERTLDRRGSSDIDMMASPKQRYYLGEDPYGGSIYGKENKYDGVRPQRTHSKRDRLERNGPTVIAATPPPEEHHHHYIQSARTISTQHGQPNVSSATLGRFSKSTNRLQNQSTSMDPDGYRSTQTLPRKLEHRPINSSKINVSIVNTTTKSEQSQQYPSQNTGPAKPARTYKSINRSKSFNVHGLNGTNDPSPIYIEKLNGNYNSSSVYKSNPHLNEAGQQQLKSPSIVNLISRSQRDLTRIDSKEEDKRFNGYLGERRYRPHNATTPSPVNGVYMNGTPDKKVLFLRGLQDRAPELYKTLHGDEEPVRNGYSSPTHNKYSERVRDRERESSLGSKSPITINKDTASIVRRGSSSTEDYSETYKITTKSDNPHRPSITNTVQTFSKKTIPSKDGRAKETFESSEMKSVTTSRYRGEPVQSNLRYVDVNDRGRRGSSGGVIIELRNNTTTRN